MKLQSTLFLLYLGACYISLPYFCVKLWRLGRPASALVFAVGPVLAWAVWQGVFRVEDDFLRMWFGIGILPFLFVSALSPIAAAAVLSDASTAAGPWAPPTQDRLASWPTARLLSLCLVGIVCYAYGATSLRTFCDFFTSAGIPGSPHQSPRLIRAALCTASSVSSWPLALLTFDLLTVFVPRLDARLTRSGTASA